MMRIFGKPRGMPMLRILFAALWVLFTVSLSHAGWLDDAVKSAAEGMGRKAVNEAADGAYQGTKKEAKDAVKGQQPADKGKQGTVPGPSGQQPAAQPGAAGGNATIENAEAVYSKYDFIPGDKVIFFDDFSDTDVGEFPRKWTLNGPKGGTTMPSMWSNTRGSASSETTRPPRARTSTSRPSTCAST
jgi:hypothetical protein